MKVNFDLKILLIILIEEILFGLLSFNTLNNVVLKLVLCLVFALILSLIKNKLVKKVICFIIPFIFLYNYLYYAMYGNILTLGIILNSGKAAQFVGVVMELLGRNILKILLILLPSLLLLLKKEIVLKLKIYLISLLSLFLISLVIIMTSNSNYIYSYKNLLGSVDNNIENVKSFGLITTKLISVERAIFGFNESDNLVINYDSNKIYDTKDYNIQNINFEALNGSDYTEISDYLSNKEPTNKNEYTGIFKNKNLIFILAESWSELGLSEKYTPTLYKLYNESIRFDSYYSPLYPVSTSDTEYMVDYSLIPSENTWSIQKVNKNYSMYSLASKLINYKTYAYHNFDYSYYQRDIYMNNLGFDIYKGCGNGLENIIDCSVNYPSDYELFSNTVDEYINDEHFFTYYVTMSGHGNYGNNHNIASKNIDLVDENYNENAKRYVSANIELDRGVEALINKLKESNKLDDTVIVMLPDHFPYALTLDEYNEALGTNKDNVFEKHHMPLIIYNSSLKNIEVSKKCSSLDLLPTLLNLFGIDYDSRLLMGHDIMSSGDDLVIFSNRSFLTKNGYYNSVTGATNLSDDEIDKIKNQIYLEYKYSRLILEKDYYRYLKGIIGE